MANWSNVRLVVIGSREEVLAFARSSRRDPNYFTAEMRCGEGGDLHWGRARRSRGKTQWEQTYYFQTARDDEKAHFRRISRQHPRCWFAIAYSDPNADLTGGHLIRNGRSRSFRISAMMKRKYRLGAGYREEAEGDDNEMTFWEAEWGMLDACVEHARREAKHWNKPRRMRGVL